MALNWDTIQAQHVKQACEMVASGQHAPKARAKGIFIAYEGQHLPAKHVLRLAYLVANSMPLDTTLKFASGEGTINLLKGLGFTVERLQQSSTRAKDPR